jgi:hypothetical protein
MSGIRSVLGCGALLILGVSCGCARSASPNSSAQANRNPLDLYFPLRDTTYTYQITVGPRAPDMFMVRVRKTGPSSAEVRTGQSSRQVAIHADSLTRQGSGTLLRLPLTEGSSWQGDKGRTVLQEVHASVQVPAGNFRDCLKTVEELGADARSRVITYYCPDVGIALMEVDEWAESRKVVERVQLRSYGPPMDLSHK